MQTQKHSEPLLGEQMQAKQSKGEGNKPFISSVVWKAPAASRWLSPPASALLNIHKHIDNNPFMQPHTYVQHRRLRGDWDSKTKLAVQQVIQSTSGSWKPSTFSLHLWQGLWGLHDLWLHKAGMLPSISHWVATDRAVTRSLLCFLTLHSVSSLRAMPASLMLLSKSYCIWFKLLKLEKCIRPNN